MKHLLNTFFVLLIFSSNALAAPKVVTLNLPTMNCVTCPITVKKALQRVDGVQKATVSYSTKQAIVTFDDEKTSIESLISATTNSGYPSSLVVEGK